MLSDAYGNLVDMLKPKEGKRFAIEHFELTEQQVQLAVMRDMINRRNETCGLTAGTYVRLVDKHKSQIVMSNTPMEVHTNYEFMRRSNGHVLVGGLGLGLILNVIQDKEEIETITVVELFQEVIDLVKPQLPLNDKVNIIQGDILQWWPENGQKWDTIYFDIWNNISEDNMEDMKRLHRRFGKRLNRDNPKCWMNSWRRNDCERMRD